MGWMLCGLLVLFSMAAPDVDSVGSVQRVVIETTNVDGLAAGTSGLVRLPQEEWLSFYFGRYTLRVENRKISRLAYLGKTGTLYVEFLDNGDSRFISFRFMDPDPRDSERVLASISRVRRSSPR
ncbi:hypothetical protein [Bryobacter aggregatus]|uniref:hypothetical protein n=1 Tax=Bryobacter aggregatus TaxID=360054 RepID=UPI0012BB04EE|nr:hypothetical protein [Bryobacter aggregatus]